MTGQIDSMQLTRNISISDRCRQSASIKPAVVERTDRLYVAKGPSSSSLLPYSANVKLTARLSALAVRKMLLMKSLTFDIMLKMCEKNSIDVLFSEQFVSLNFIICFLYKL